MYQQSQNHVSDIPTNNISKRIESLAVRIFRSVGLLRRTYRANRDKHLFTVLWRMTLQATKELLFILDFVISNYSNRTKLRQELSTQTTLLNPTHLPKSQATTIDPPLLKQMSEARDDIHIHFTNQTVCPFSIAAQSITG